tara:strand:- start:72 stop:911 length:840 start_codon:yes stop_codon:yes gene_type:complete
MWSLRSHNCCGSWIPSYGYQQQLSSGGGGAGISYLTGIPQFIPWYFLIFIILGLLASFKNYKKYIPIYIYLILSLFIHMKFRGHSDQIMYVTPLLYGFMALFILSVKNKVKTKSFFQSFLAILLAAFLIVGAINGYTTTKNWGTRNDVIEQSMQWFNENSNPEDTILVGDMVVYSYFTDRPLVSYASAGAWVGQFINQNPSIQDPMVAYTAFLASNNIKYFVAYDSTMSWFYTNTEPFAKQFRSANFQFAEVTTQLIPLKKFSANNEEIILYEVRLKND